MGLYSKQVWWKLSSFRPFMSHCNQANLWLASPLTRILQKDWQVSLMLKATFCEKSWKKKSKSIWVCVPEEVDSTRASRVDKEERGVMEVWGIQADSSSRLVSFTKVTFARWTSFLRRQRSRTFGESSRPRLLISAENLFQRRCQDSLWTEKLKNGANYFRLVGHKVGGSSGPTLARLSKTN